MFYFTLPTPPLLLKNAILVIAVSLSVSPKYIFAQKKDDGLTHRPQRATLSMR